MLNFANLDLRQGFLAHLTGRRGRTRSQAVSKRATLDIKGDPIVWKDFHRGEPGSFFNPGTQTILFLLLVAAVYICAVVTGIILEPAFHAVLVTILAALGFLRTAMLSATSISSEKQARTWPILLTTPFDDSRIVNAKIKAIIKKTAPFWLIIAADVVVFTIIPVFNGAALLAIPMAVLPTVIFLLGLGLYAGMRLKTPTGAVAMTFIVPFAMWFVCPCLMYINPLVMIAISVGPDDMLDAFGMLFTVGTIPPVIYTVVGLILLAMTKSSMRK